MTDISVIFSENVILTSYLQNNASIKFPTRNSLYLHYRELVALQNEINKLSKLHLNSSDNQKGITNCF